MKHLNDENKTKIYNILSRLFSNNYSLKVHQKIIEIAKQNLIDISHINDISSLKFPEKDFESQFSFLKLIHFYKEQNNILYNSLKKETNILEINTSPEYKINLTNNKSMNSEDKNNNNIFNNLNNYLNVENELNIQRISTLNINLNERYENSFLKESEDIEYQQHKFKNMEIDINKIFDIERNKMDKDEIHINPNEEEFILRINKTSENLPHINKEINNVEEEFGITDKIIKYNQKIFESFIHFKEYKENILQGLLCIQSMIQLLEYMITFKDTTLFEMIDKKTSYNSNFCIDYNNKAESDIFSFNKGFIFQNYINNGIVLDPINNFPKKGYSILFSFKWEPLSQIALEKKCDLFHFLETKVMKNEKEKKDKADFLTNNAEKSNTNGFDFSLNNEEFNKSIKLGCYILNRKIHVLDSNKSYNTNIEVIPGVSYVLLLDQKESRGFVKKISKVNFSLKIFYINFSFQYM
jgi:hypothetical protein